MSDLWKKDQEDNENQGDNFEPITGQPINVMEQQTRNQEITKEESLNQEIVSGEMKENNQEASRQEQGFYHFSREEIPRDEFQDYNNPYLNPEKRNKPKKKFALTPLQKRWGSCLGMALAFGVVAGVTMWGVNSFANQVAGTSNKAPTKKVEVSTTVSDKAGPIASPVSEQGTYSVSGVAKQAMPSIVAITNKSVQEVQSWFGGQSQPYQSESSGSGIIVGQNDEELLIATNNHVVSGATTLSVAFTDNAVSEAQIKGTQPDKDLAVIAVKLKDIPKETLDIIKVIQLGSSESLEVGEPVVAIGNALGYGQSVTTGCVSALDRDVTIENITNTLIQTDAAINPGNSGGALLNMKGELIGINAAKFASNQVEGMGYAIPVKTAKPILDELMNRQTRTKVEEKDSAYIGIAARTVSKETATAYGMKEGVYVAEVTSGGPAEAAGVKKSDIITKVDGISVFTYEDLINNLQYYKAGETIEIVVARANNGEYTDTTLSITLGNKEDMPKSTPQDGNRVREQQQPQDQLPDIFDFLP